MALSLKSGRGRAYQKRLREIIDASFMLATYYGWTHQNFADQADVHVSTIQRYDTHKVEFPMFYTVWRLSTAVGIDIGILNDVQALKKPKRLKIKSA